MSCRRVVRRGRAVRERGAASVFVVGMSIMLFVCAGLVVDGGLAINARMTVADDAEQASRVGADTIDLDRLRSSGDIRIDEIAAVNRVNQFMADRGYSGGQYTVAANFDSVTVTVRDRVDSMFLQVIAIPGFDVEARATSSPETDF
jgi:Flp pilus assembly protein TadG